MHKARNTLLSVGAAVIGTKLARSLSGLEFDDVLRPLGLSRRRNHWPENLVFLGVGLVVGGATALMLAPSSGRDTRERLRKKAEEFNDAAMHKANGGGELRADVAVGRGNGDTTQVRPLG